MTGKGLDGDRGAAGGDLEPAIPDGGLARRQGDRGEAAPRGFAGVAGDEDLAGVGDQLGAGKGRGDVAVAGEAFGEGGEAVPARRTVAAAGAG